MVNILPFYDRQNDRIVHVNQADLPSTVSIQSNPDGTYEVIGGPDDEVNRILQRNRERLQAHAPAATEQ